MCTFMMGATLSELLDLAAISQMWVLRGMCCQNIVWFYVVFVRIEMVEKMNEKAGLT